MVKNKNIKARVSKAEQSALDKKIMTGSLLTLLFIVLFFITWDAYQKRVQEQIKEQTPFEELSEEEQIAYVKSEEESVQDSINLQRALSFQDRKYCENIVDEDIKKNCIAQTPEPVAGQEPEVVQEPESEQDTLDKINYQRAKSFNDKSYCENIQNSELQETCKSEIA